MLSHLVKAGAQRKVLFLHANDSAESFALRQQVSEDLENLADGSMVTWLLAGPDAAGAADGSPDVRRGFMDARDLDLPGDAEYYLCGPVVFIQSVRTALIARGVPPKDIQYEVFGPDLWLADYQ
jgi:nitric oxide dioxygenase